LGSNILGQMFINNNGFNADIEDEDHNPTLYITGGLTNRSGEYARPLSLHGKHISLFAKGSDNSQNSFPVTDSELSLETENFRLNLGDGTTLKLFRRDSDKNNLMTAGNLKINAGIQTNGQSEEYIYYEVSKGVVKKINKRSNPLIYLTFKDSNNNDLYLLDNS
jgi:hypothetical protein